jgi:hypothetical protein
MLQGTAFDTLALGRCRCELLRAIPVIPWPIQQRERSHGQEVE